MAEIVTAARIKDEVHRAKLGTVRVPLRIELSQPAWESLKATPVGPMLPDAPPLRLFGLPVRVWSGLEHDCQIVTA